ncbi:MAG: hypothetical protein QF634_12505 [Vicinamibacterales bacterium]|nr:hypothetical protein [Vicinamibacterales bacterium]
MRAAGFRQSAEDNRDTVARTPLVLIAAHGLSHTERHRLSAAHEAVIDTTCPLVRRAHDAAVELQAERRHLLLIGQPGHVEVRGLIGDLDSYDVIADPTAVRRYEHQRLGIVSQTTTPPDLVAAICTRIQQRNPLADIRVIDTVCQPTRLRLDAVLDLVQRVAAIVVVGGRNSNNTHQLVQLCHEHRTPALHVERADELDPDWFDDVHTVGLTAGTSTLDETVDEVHRALERMGPHRQEVATL